MTSRPRRQAPQHRAGPVLGITATAPRLTVMAAGVLAAVTCLPLFVLVLLI